MREIILTQGYKSLVDDNLFEELSKYNWFAEKRNKSIYSRAHIKNNFIYMHRFIMNIYDKNIQVDHIDGNGLNNQISNLRFCNHSQNQMNKINTHRKVAKYKGIYRKKYLKKNGEIIISWGSSIKTKDNKIHLGIFKTDIEAAKAYNDAALKYFGEFANINKLEI